MGGHLKKIGGAVAFGVAVAVAFLSAGGGASAYVPTPPYVTCLSTAETNLASLETSLSPATGATAQLGATVTLSGRSTEPLEFAIASSTADLASLDIDGGAGSPEPAAPEDTTWSFDSTKATAIARTVYWDASFSDSAIPSCAGMTPTTFTTRPRELGVLAPVTAPAVAPASAVPSCVVPALRGERLPRARRSLRTADCRVGRVLRPAHGVRGPLVVVAQMPTAGRHLGAGSRVGVRLGRPDGRRAQAG